MTKTRAHFLALLIVAVSVAAAVFAASARVGASAESYSIGTGSPVPTSELSQLTRAALTATGGVRGLSVIGTRAGHVFYRLDAPNGDTCYARGTAALPRQLGTIGCLDGDRLPMPLVDMSTVVVDPKTGSLVRLASSEGIAADQVAAVGIEVNGSLRVQTSVANNLYHFDEAAIPADPSAIVALDDGGRVLWRKPLR